MKTFQKQLQKLFTIELRMPEYIVTHPAPRHLDEAFGVALIHWLHYMLVGNLTLHKLKVLEMPRAHQMGEDEKALWAERLRDPAYMFIDTGGELDWGLNNLDHHQDTAIPSASVLAWEWANQYLSQNWDKLPFNMLRVMNRVRVAATAISELETQHSFDSHRDALKALPLWLKELRMAAMARGLEDGKNLVSQVMELFITEQYIGSKLHREITDEGFDYFFTLCKQVKENLQETAHKRIAQLSKFVPGWREGINGDKYDFVLLQDSRDETWSLNAVDSSRVAINKKCAEDENDLIFCHNNLFVAKFQTREAAVRTALQSL